MCGYVDSAVTATLVLGSSAMFACYGNGELMSWWRALANESRSLVWWVDIPSQLDTI